MGAFAIAIFIEIFPFQPAMQDLGNIKLRSRSA